jgi:MFS family permease
VISRLRATLGAPTLRNFGLDAGSTALFAVFQALISPFVLVVAVRRGAVPWEVGLIAAAPNAAMLLSAWYARLAEGRPLVAWVALTTAAGRLLMLLAAWSRHMGLYIGAYAASGLLQAAANPAYTAIERAIYEQRWRGQLMAGVRSILGLIQFGATLAAGTLLDRFGTARTWTAAVIFGVASSALFSRLREPPRAARAAAAAIPARRPGGALSLLRADGRFRALILAVMLAGGGNLLVSPGYALYQVHRLHLSDGGVAALTAVWALAWTVCYPIWGRVCDRHRPATVITLSFACYALPPLCYAAGAGFHLLLAAYVVQGVGDSALDAGWQNHVMRLAGDRTGTYAGAYFTFLGMRGTAAPLLGSLLAARLGLRALFLTGAACVLAGLACARHLPDGPLEAGPRLGAPLGAPGPAAGA